MRRNRVDKLVFAMVGLVSATIAAEPVRLGDAEVSFRITVGQFGTTNRVSHSICSADMASLRLSETNGAVYAVWTGGDEEFGPDFSVFAHFVPDGADRWEYEFAYSGSRSALPLLDVQFPIVTVPRTDDTAVVYPDSTGAICFPEWKDVADGEQVAWARPRSFHFIASLDESCGNWYVDQRGNARSETVTFEARKGVGRPSVELVAACTPPAQAQGAWVLPFPGVIAKYSGGWFEAAQIYRQWAWRQTWYDKASARDLGPLKEISMWIWNRGCSDAVLPAVEKFRRESGVPVALDWYWWHEIPYDMCFPNFWPPREGIEGFRKGIRRCRDTGVFVMPYVNGMTWDMDDPSWAEGGEGDARLTIDGQFRAYAYNRFSNHRLAFMCGRAPVYQARMRKLCRQLTDSGMPGIYLDMIGHSSYEPCYSAAHGHVPGGGTVGVEGNREFVEMVRRENPGVRLATEEASESYLENFDAGICLNFCYERFGYGNDRKQYLPVAMAVYHGVAAYFGSFAMVHNLPAFDPKWPADRKWKTEKDWPALFPDQFAVEFLRGVVWGVQPTVHNYRPEDLENRRYDEDWKLMLDTARFHHENRSFLFDGQMLSPGKMVCATMQADFLIRGTYAREGEYKVCRRTNLPAVFHSVWKALDGRTALILCNWTRSPQKFEVVTPDVTSRGEVPARSWRKISF